MSALDNHDAALAALAASLAAAMPERYVQRSLVDPATVAREKLLAGLVCVVSEGGGEFANRVGRWADLGTMNVRLVAFVAVAEKGTTGEDVERAELAVLGEVLSWCSTAAVAGIDLVTVQDWQQSKQLEHPYGWLVVALRVKN